MPAMRSSTRSQVVQARDDAVQEMLAGIDVDAADDPLGDAAEVGVQVKQQVDAGGEQEQAAHAALDRDHAQNDPCARRIAGAHRRS